MSELEYLKGQMEDLEKKIEDEEIATMNREGAEAMHGIMDALLKTGFSDEQAFTILLKLMDYAHQM